MASSFHPGMLLSALGAVYAEDFADTFAEVLEITQRVQDCSGTGVVISFGSFFIFQPAE